MAHKVVEAHIRPVLVVVWVLLLCLLVVEGKKRMMFIRLYIFCYIVFSSQALVYLVEELLILNIG